MAAEAAPVIEALDAREVDRPEWAGPLPARLFHQPDHDGLDIMIGTNGTDPVTGVDCIGGHAAVLATLVLLRAHEPDLVLSAGTAGGWSRNGAEIGDVYVAWDRFVHHDRRIDIPGFDSFGIGDHPAADIREAAFASGCRLGTVTTGESLDEAEVDRDRIIASGAEVKDMEAAAVAWVARIHGVPVSAVKAVTDLVDSPVATETQFVANLETATTELTAKLLELLPRIATLDLGGSSS